jgi:thioredoxin 2
VASTIVTCPNCGRRNRVAATGEGTPRCAVCHFALPWIVGADDAGFDDAVRASVPVVVDLWAPWCGPCKWVEPIVESIARDRAGALKVVKVDIDHAPVIAKRYGVQHIPTLIVLRDGVEVDRLMGAASKPQLESWLERHADARAAS